MRDLRGQTFGSYRLEEPLGRGGMGEVYRARHLRLTNRAAAVKVLPSYLAAEPDFLRRFEHEANSAASLDHPNILPVWDYGEQDGVPYLAMPLVPGGSLKELLEREGPLSPRRAGEFLSQIGAALDYAHGRGIIHRDVKPANIFLREDGRPLLADFGIAKAIEEGQGQGITRAGTGVGTPEYMAPEQIEGRAEPRSDLYALGVVLYQMLTGSLPYSGSTPYEVAYKQMYTPLRPIRDVNPSVPPAIERVLNRALAKSPSERYGSARELAEAYNRALSEPDAPYNQRTGPLIIAPGDTMVAPVAPAYPQPQPASPARPVAYHPPPLPQPTRDERRGSRAPLVLAGLLGALLLLCVGGFLAIAALNRGATPTATPDRQAGQAAAATQTAAAAQAASAGAAAGTQTALAVRNAEATGAALRQGESATATAQARAEAQTATAQARAEGGTATAQARAEGGTATAVAAQNAAATQTAGAQAQQTATAQAQPTVTPTRAPTIAPTTPPTAGAWGPALPTLSGGKAYSDPGGRFSFSVPQQWTQNTGSSAQAQFDAPNRQATMNVTLENVPAATTIDQYNTSAEAQLKRQLPDYQQVALDKVTVNGQQAYRRVYKATITGTGLVQLQQVYFISNGVAHIMTFASLPENFDRQSQTFNQIAGTYKAGP